MNQPIRAYPINQGTVDVGSKTPILNISPQLKKRLKPLPDSSGLLQLTQTKKSNTQLESPVKLRIKNVKNTLMETESGNGDNGGRLSLNLNRKTFHSAFSEQNSPQKKVGGSPPEGTQKFFVKVGFCKVTKLKGLQFQGRPSSNNKKDTHSREKQLVIATWSGNIKGQLGFEIVFTKKQGDNTPGNKKYQEKQEESEVSLGKSFNASSPNKSRIMQSDNSPLQKRRTIHIPEQISGGNGVGGVGHLRSSSNPNIAQKPQQQELDDVKTTSLLKLIVQKYYLLFDSNKIIGRLELEQADQNQSRFGILQPKFLWRQEQVFKIKNYYQRYYLGVCDGHGTYGHFVSQIIKKILPGNLESYLKQQAGRNSGGLDDLGPKEESQVLRSFAQAFSKTSREINSCGVDVTFSGTTCVTVMISGQHIWCANIGDSRAVLYFLKDGMWNIQPLSNDHKPDNPIEKRRIINAKGRVEPFYGQDGNPMGPSRVWLLHEQVPGLAMSRSFGDYVASTVGVVADPEVTYFNVDFEWGFLVVASDGVWEFLSNERICELLQTQPYEGMNVRSLESIANLIVKESTKQWQLEDEVIDDISVIIALIQSKP